MPGAFADLVLFDTATVADRATPAEPQATSVGIASVWVNGELAFHGGNDNQREARPGHPARRLNAPAVFRLPARRARVVVK